MEFRNIAVLFDADNFDPDLIALASHLAQRHNAHLTGVMAAELPLIAMGIDGTAAVAAMYIEQRAVLESSYKEAGKAFSSEVPKGLSHR